MTINTITQLSDPQGFSPDPLTGLLRSGAQRLIEQAVEAELAVLLEEVIAANRDAKVSLRAAEPWASELICGECQQRTDGGISRTILGSSGATR